MKVCLVGGIYGQQGTPSGYLRSTPETTLEAGLRAAGHHVTTLSHYASIDFGRFDVVHVHHLSFGATRMASDPSAAPFLFTAHDASEMSGARLPLDRSLALRFVLSRADRLVCLSRVEAEFQQAAKGIEADRLATIPNGIDGANFPFHPRQGARPGRPWQLLFVGQLIPLKGCDLILEALAQLPHHAVLTLAYQSAEMEAQLKALASSLGLTDRVHFVGRQEPAQLAALYRHSDLLILASQTEALPSVITEAMLCGLPFVSTAVGGIPEQAAGFGRLVTHRTSAALTEAISHVLSTYEQFAGESAAMSRYARGTYTIETMVSRHVELYESVRGQRPRRHRRRSAAANAIVRAAVARFGTRPHTAGGRASSAGPGQRPLTEKS